MDIRWFENQNPGWTAVLQNDIKSIEADVCGFFTIQTISDDRSIQALYMTLENDFFKVKLDL